MMSAVLQRPMFRPQIVRRQTGTPPSGETKSSTVTMQGPINSFKFNLLDRLGVISNKSLGREVPEKEFQINIDDAMSNPQLVDSVFDMIISSTGFDLDSFLKMGSSQQEDYIKTIQGKLLFGKAEGGEIKSDAVGIADGLDKETPKADPNTEGVAKVSPQQYVELMNQVRGDEVPLEGRVQELAMTVGEKDAQDTPLSVLALVQPVFELQEKQGGLAAAPRAQQMLQQDPMRMKEGGIVYRQNGTDEEGENAFTTLTTAGFDPNLLKAVEQFGKEYFGVGSEFDTAAVRKQYEDLLMDKSQLRDQAFLDAAPRLLKLGSVALNPQATLSDVFQVGAAELAGFGTGVGKQTKEIKDAALKLALAEKTKQENKESSFMSAIAPELIKSAFKDPQEVALKALEINELTLKNAKSEAELGVLDEQLITQLATDKATLQKILTENKYLPQSTQLSIERQLREIEGIEFDNENKILDNEFKQIQNRYAEDKENATLQNQLLENINKQLNNFKLGVENEYIRTEKDLGVEQLNANIDSVLASTQGQMITNEMNEIELENLNSKLFLEAMEKKLEIEKLQNEIDNPKKDFEQIREESSFRKEFKALKVVKDTESRYDSYRKMRIAIEASNNPDAGGAGDVALVFEFMKMLDPNSTVREGEYATAKNTGGVPDNIVNTYNALLSGQFLNNKQRTEFLNIAEGIFESQLSQYNTEYNTYAGIAERNFGADNVKNVLPLPSFNIDDIDEIVSEDSISKFLDAYDNNLSTNQEDR